jgi:4-aminobutyrate aminotransferase
MNAEMGETDDFLDLVAQIPEFLAPSLAEDWPKLPVVKAEGAYLHTADGRRYLDFTSGIAVANVGHSHPRVVEAARRQIENMIHGAVGITIHESLLRLCKALPEVLPPNMDMFFFGNSGAEAIEGAIKLARYVTGRPAIIAFDGGFHGRSYGAASVTSAKSKYRLHYEPFVPGVYFAPYANPYRCPLGEGPDAATEWSLAGLRRLFDHQVPPSEVAAILVEPVQGEGGYIVPPASFLQGLRSICDEHGILLILDEIQTGFGRTGDMFAAQVFDVQPDIMAIAKGIASGFPLSATVASRKLMSQWKAGSHGTTFGGNAVACAAALATLDIIREENLLANCREMGTRMLDAFHEMKTKYSFVGDVRGLGLMLALEMIVPDTEKRPNSAAVTSVLDHCLERGLVAYMAGTQSQVLRFIPPLNVTPEQADDALQILDDSLAAYWQESR